MGRESIRGPLRSMWGERATADRLTEGLERASLAAAAHRPVTAERIERIAPGLCERAMADRGQPWPQALASDFARYFRDGNRTAYETGVRGRHERLSRAVVMTLVAEQPEERDAWLDDVVDGVMLFCEQSTWCWAAHDDVRSRRGHVLPDTASPFLDLGAGEAVAQLAWIDLALAAELDARYPGLRERVRLEATERVFVPFVSRRDWHWLGLDGDIHNWNPWIHGNVIVAACALVDDRAERAHIVALAIEGLDRYLESLPADGAIDEGYAYWWNGACRALEALEVLELASDGRLAARGLDLLSALVRFPARMHIGERWYVNVADAPARLLGPMPWRTLAHYGSIAGDRTAVAHAAAQAARPEPGVESIGLGRLLLALADADWPPPREDPAPTAEISTWLDSVQLMVARNGGQPELLVAAKGGHNGEHHNHLDVGSVIVAVQGIPVLVDAGQPTYTAQTFGPDRYAIRTMRSGWHTLPAPWGLEQSLGRDAAATASFADHDGDAKVVLELARPYRLPAGSRWTRTVTLSRTSGQATIDDAWLLPRPEQVTYDGVLLHHLVYGEVTVTGPGSALVGPPAALPGRPPVLLRWEGAPVEFRIEMWPLRDPLLERVWGDHLVRLTVGVRAPLDEAAFKGSIRLVLRPAAH